MQRHYASALLAALITQIIFFIWLAVPVANTQLAFGYPRIGSIPGPGVFVDHRITVYTVFVGLLLLNGLLPFLLMTAVQQNDVSELGALHSFISAVLVIMNTIIFLFIGITWFVTCNNGMGSGNTACHDPRYCCANYALNSDTRELCPNNAGCSPAVESRNLVASSAWKGHFVFSAVFALTAWGHLAVNRRLAVYGVLET